MKKVALVLVLVICLVALVAGGVTTLAQGDLHEPMVGKKLVGAGYLGYVELPHAQQMQWNISHFVMTNPDCVENITIERLSIIRGDGTLIYEGPFYATYGVRNETNRTVDVNNVIREEVTTLAPHDTVDVVLAFIMPDGADGWLSYGDAMNLFVYGYTVEVFYSTKGLELIGFAEHTKLVYEASLQLRTHALWSTPMVNMEQQVKAKGDK